MKVCAASVFNQVATEVAAAMLESVLLLGPRLVAVNSEVLDKLLNTSGLQFPSLSINSAQVYLPHRFILKSKYENKCESALCIFSYFPYGISSSSNINNNNLWNLFPETAPI